VGGFRIFGQLYPALGANPNSNAFGSNFLVLLMKYICVKERVSCDTVFSA